MDSPEERIASLLALLPAPPEAWVRAAQELPALRATVADIAARAEDDAAFRARLVDDLERALELEGYDPNARLLRAVRRRLASS